MESNQNEIHTLKNKLTKSNNEYNILDEKFKSTSESNQNEIHTLKEQIKQLENGLINKNDDIKVLKEDINKTKSNESMLKQILDKLKNEKFDVINESKRLQKLVQNCKSNFDNELTDKMFSIILL